ncbi:MAG: PqqD family protein [Bacteroidales bacterium]|nr:PqqD family protein [Bacteroidales bacterium]
MMKIKTNIAISDSGFVFDPSTGESFTFNPTGLEIFRYLKEGKEIGEITEIITTKYDIDSHIFERFFYDFTSMLKQYQLIDNE